jgi:anti-sigma-K factor RskA
VFSGGWWRNAVLWRTLTLGGLLVAVLGVGAWASMHAMMESHINNLSTQLSKVRHVNQLAVLTDGKAQVELLVTLDGQKNPVKVQRVGRYAEPADRTLQVWALPTDGSTPRHLGTLTRGNTLQRLETEPAALRDVAAVGITLEPIGSAPADTGPTGPMLFKGQLIPNL